MESERGYFRDINGDLHEGYIALQNNKIRFSDDPDDKGRKVSFKEIQYFSILEDSFLITQNLVEQGLYSNKIEALNYFTSFDKYNIARFNTNSEIKYAVNIQGQQSWNVIPTSNNRTFRLYCKSLFTEAGFLVEDLNEKEYSKEDLLKVIGVVESYFKYINKSALYFDKYWQITYAPESIAYKGYITGFNDGVFDLEVFEDDTKLYQLNFSSLYPIIIEKELLAYYSNGNIRKKTKYMNGIATENMTYWPNGNLHYHYVNTANQDQKELNTIFQKAIGKNYSEDKYFDHNSIYIKVYDENGKSLLDNNGNGIEKILDKSGDKKREVERVFDQHCLVNSFVYKDGKKIYQVTDKNYNLRLNKLQSLMKETLLLENADDAHEDKVQGAILVSVEIDEKGRVQKTHLLNKLHPEVNKLLKQMSHSLLDTRLRKFKVDNQPVAAEIVIPVVFKLGLFHSIPVSPFGHWQMLNQMQMHQMHNPYMSAPINPPAMQY